MFELILTTLFSGLFLSEIFFTTYNLKCVLDSMKRKKTIVCNDKKNPYKFLYLDISFIRRIAWEECEVTWTKKEEFHLLLGIRLLA